VTIQIAALNAEINRVTNAANACLADQNHCALLTPIVMQIAPDRTQPWATLDPTINTYRSVAAIIAPDQKVVQIAGDFWTQCQNHDAGRFGPTQWMIQFISTKTGAVLLDETYPGRPLKVPGDTQVNVHVIDFAPGDNCVVSDGSSPPSQIRLFTPVFPDDY
jgi:hypothetical protein